ncbi:hypothetical protein [Streptomyces sp. NPDC005096]|uniref:hypothetical protein n=1 Tax=Streptomyces sp. NPDC005096 TaxID=3154559 RepID=UPI0033B250FE
MAFYIYGGAPDAGSLASAATHRFTALAHTARTSADLQPLLASVRAMSRADKAALLEDTMDMWVGMHAMNITPTAHIPGSAAQPATHQAGQALPDELFLDDTKIAPPGADYRVHTAISDLPDGTMAPLLLVEPTGPAAGFDDLSQRCGWPALADDMNDPLWLVHVDEHLGTLHSITRLATDASGQRRDGWGDDFTDLYLGHATTATPLPQEYITLLRSTGEVVMIGPAAASADATVLADPDRLLSVRARIVFDTYATCLTASTDGPSPAPHRVSREAAPTQSSHSRHPSAAELLDIDIDTTPSYDAAMGPCIDLSREISDAVYGITLTTLTAAGEKHVAAVLRAVSDSACAADLKYRCLWQHPAATMPPVDNRWLVTIDADTRTIASISHDVDEASGEPSTHRHVYPLTLNIDMPGPQLTSGQVDHLRSAPGLLLVGPLESGCDLDDALNKRDLLIVHAAITVA